MKKLNQNTKKKKDRKDWTGEGDETMNKSIYIDNNATTQVDQRVLNEMLPYFCEKFGNPSSSHIAGRCVREAIESSRNYIAENINCHPDEIFFTSGGTESNNLAIIGYSLSNKNKSNHIITSPIEHPSVKAIFHKYLKSLGFEISFIEPDKNGVIRIERIKEEIRQSTILVSIMHANNVTGVIQPIESIGKICKESDIVFHTDAVQSFGKIPVDVKKNNISMLSASSHKIYGPKGCGFLYLKNGIEIIPRFFGGHQQNGIRVGTENVPGIIGFAEAFKLCNKLHLKEEIKITKIRDKFEQLVIEKIKDCIIIGNNTERIPGTSNIGFKNIAAQDLLNILERKEIFASPGSACAEFRMKKHMPSPVLSAMKVNPEYINGCIRFSFGRFNQIEDVEKIVKVLISGTEKLQ